MDMMFGIFEKDMLNVKQAALKNFFFINTKGKRFPDEKETFANIPHTHTHIHLFHVHLLLLFFCGIKRKIEIKIHFSLCNSIYAN